jgi:uncharacterized repeat protein (TIGR03803 family)
MSASGTVATLHVFAGPEGAVPTSLIQGRDGFFYGTATYGGEEGITPLQPANGTIFRMSADGEVTVLHVFAGASGGFRPGPIVQGADGALYGGALGGVGWGFVYRFDLVTSEFRHLHDFVSSDGRWPTGPLFQGSDGFFYGTTREGGPWNSGVIYKVDALGNFVLLHGLSPLFPGEGSQPKGGVIQASDGFLYGTTESGYGSVFRLDTAGDNFTVMHRFDAYAGDGWKPVTGLIEGTDGFLYGTAPSGGRSATVGQSALGVVYRMDKSGGFTVLRSFSGADGRTPLAALLQAANGLLYGSTALGGASGLGVLFGMEAVVSTPTPLPTLLALTCSPSNVVGGQNATATVTLGGPAPSGGAVVALASSSSVVAVPATVTVPAGAWQVTLVASTVRVKKTTTATIKATYNDGSVSGKLTVTR